jgi:hypothetical protein
VRKVCGVSHGYIFPPGIFSSECIDSHPERNETALNNFEGSATVAKKQDGSANGKAANGHAAELETESPLKLR